MHISSRILIVFVLALAIQGLGFGPVPETLATGEQSAKAPIWKPGIVIPLPNNYTEPEGSTGMCITAVAIPDVGLVVQCLWGSYFITQGPGRTQFHYRRLTGAGKSGDIDYNAKHHHVTVSRTGPDGSSLTVFRVDDWRTEVFTQTFPGHTDGVRYNQSGDKLVVANLRQGVIAYRIGTDGTYSQTTSIGYPVSAENGLNLRVYEEEGTLYALISGSDPWTGRAPFLIRSTAPYMDWALVKSFDLHRVWSWGGLPIELKDYDSDGDVDVLIVHNGLNIYRGDGNGSFAPNPEVYLSGINGRDLNLQDATGDGENEVVVATGKAVEIYSKADLSLMAIFTDTENHGYDYGGGGAVNFVGNQCPDVVNASIDAVVVHEGLTCDLPGVSIQPARNRLQLGETVTATLHLTPTGPIYGFKIVESMSHLKPVTATFSVAGMSLKSVVTTSGGSLILTVASGTEVTLTNPVVAVITYTAVLTGLGEFYPTASLVISQSGQITEVAAAPLRTALEVTCPPRDPNGDCRVNVLDAKVVFDYVGQNLTPPYQAAYDFDGNGRVSLADVVAILRYIVNPPPLRPQSQTAGVESGNYQVGIHLVAEESEEGPQAVEIHFTQSGLIANFEPNEGLICEWSSSVIACLSSTPIENLGTMMTTSLDVTIADKMTDTNVEVVFLTEINPQNQRIWMPLIIR